MITAKDIRDGRIDPGGVHSLFCSRPSGHPDTRSIAVRALENGPHSLGSCYMQSGAHRPKSEGVTTIMSEAILRDVITLGGLALQAEDCLLRAAVHSRGEHGGLVRNQNERYYQFLIWRAVLAKWHAATEKTAEGWDLIATVDGTNHYFELKNWRGTTGNNQLSPMQKDIDKLSRVADGYFVVVSDNPPSETESNFSYLLTKLHGLIGQRQDYRFSTHNEFGHPHEFWIAGWPVVPAS